MKTIHAFDFDGTVTRSDTFIGFMRHCRGLSVTLLILLRYLPRIVLMMCGLADNGRTKELVFGRCFRGMPEDRFLDYCRSYGTTATRLLRPAAVAAIRAAHQHGDTVVIVTASIDLWVRPIIAAALPDVPIEVIGTQAELADGMVSGCFATPNCHGAEKVVRLRQRFPDRAAYRLVAYGDSSGDRQLLDYADEQHYRAFGNS